MTESNFLLVQNKLSPVVWWVCSAHFPQCLPARNIRRQQTQVIWITFCCGIFWFLLLYPRNVVVRDWEYNRLFPLYLSLPLSSDGFPYWLFESHSQGDIEETSHFPLTVFWTERERERDQHFSLYAQSFDGQKRPKENNGKISCCPCHPDGKYGDKCWDLLEASEQFVSKTDTHKCQTTVNLCLLKKINK